MEYLLGSTMDSAASSDSSMTTYFFLGILIAAVIGLVIYLVVGRAETRPVKQGFYGGAITGSSALSCGRMSSEAEALYAMFAGKDVSGSEDGKTDLRDLKNLLSKLCCFKQDLMAPQQTITAVKELKFTTNQDIQPLGDLTGRCFSKTVPERDLDIQFIKWRDAGKTLIHRLCTAASLNEGQVLEAEKLFEKVWKDVQNVAHTQCLSGAPVGMFKTGPHEPAANTPEDVMDLRDYDGLY